MTSTSSSSKKILVVEDEEDIQELMVLHLKREGWSVQACSDGDEALKRVLGAGPQEFDAIVLDWMLPGASGLQIARSIRSSKWGLRVPILMVTARTEPADIVAGLESGCDDYVTKPFDVPVFLARMRALFRRADSMKDAASESRVLSRIQMGALEIRIDEVEVWRGPEKLELTPSEFKLLVAMAKNQGKVLTREQLIELVQGEGVSVVDRAIDTHVFGLRKKLGKEAEWIETVRGVGYRVKYE
jgi:two-component system phosphate regulon response regulator PhoB